MPLHPKVEQILTGARATFVDLGYEGATVDEIARRAKVSKPTLYVHLGDKRAIFAAVLKRDFEAQARNIFTAVPEDVPVEAALRDIARHYIAFLLSEPAQELFRIAVAEARRFPELGLAFYDSGPGLGVARLAAYLRAASAREELVVDDVELAAHQFTELCRADLFYRRLFRGEVPRDRDIRRTADAAVSMFIAAYRRT